MENGDKAYYCYQGTAVLKDGAPQTETGPGKGTYKGTAGADGTMTYEVQGEYQSSPKQS